MVGYGAVVVRGRVPVCNKLVLLAPGCTGAMTWLGPVKPLLALGSVGLLGWALRARLRSTVSFPTKSVRFT